MPAVQCPDAPPGVMCNPSVDGSNVPQMCPSNLYCPGQRPLGSNWVPCGDLANTFCEPGNPDRRCPDGSLCGSAVPPPPPSCQPRCPCGGVPDGCGGVCPPLPAACAGRECGPVPLCPLSSQTCGTCPTGSTCDKDGKCAGTACPPGQTWYADLARCAAPPCPLQPEHVPDPGWAPCRVYPPGQVAPADGTWTGVCEKTKAPCSLAHAGEWFCPDQQRCVPPATTNAGWGVDESSHACVEGRGGPHATKEECRAQSFAFNGAECHPAGQADADGELYASKASCLAANAEETGKKWKYQEATRECVPSGDGDGTGFESAAACRRDKYRAAPGTGVCIPAVFLPAKNTGLFTDRASCEATVRSAWTFDGEECRRRADGEYATRQECRTAHPAPPPVAEPRQRTPGMRTVYLVNRSSEPVWPGLTQSLPGRGKSGAGHATKVDPAVTGFQLLPGEARAIELPADFSGRLWPRTGCAETTPGGLKCQTGQCGGGEGKMLCKDDSSIPPATLAEFTFDPTVDWLDISNVDGYNIGLRVSALRAGTTTPFAPPLQCVMRDPTETAPDELRVPGGFTSLCYGAAASGKHPILERVAADTSLTNLVCCRCGPTQESGTCLDAKCEYGCSPLNKLLCGPGAERPDPACGRTECDGPGMPAQPFSRTCNGGEKQWERGGRCYVEQWPVASNGVNYENVIKGQCGMQTYTWMFDDYAALRQLPHEPGDGPDYVIEFLGTATDEDIEMQLETSMAEPGYQWDNGTMKCEHTGTGPASLMECLATAPSLSSKLDPEMRFVCDEDTGAVVRAASGSGQPLSVVRDTCRRKRFRCEAGGHCAEIWDPLEKEPGTMTGSECKRVCGSK
jgi:hypothetical protein